MAVLHYIDYCQPIEIYKLNGWVSLIFPKNLHISLDNLVFGENERGPDDALKLQFEAVSELDEKDKFIVLEVLEGLIIKYQARRWSRITNMPATKGS